MNGHARHESIRHVRHESKHGRHESVDLEAQKEENRLSPQVSPSAQSGSGAIEYEVSLHKKLVALAFYFFLSLGLTLQSKIVLQKVRHIVDHPHLAASIPTIPKNLADWPRRRIVCFSLYSHGLTYGYYSDWVLWINVAGIYPPQYAGHAGKHGVAGVFFSLYDQYCHLQRLTVSRNPPGHPSPPLHLQAVLT